MIRCRKFFGRLFRHEGVFYGIFLPSVLCHFELLTLHDVIRLNRGEPRRPGLGPGPHYVSRTVEIRREREDLH
jgi:hypothetical protein